ncbi:LPXTG cell wall anchor domain-containing protein [Vagococcus silagei]|uniref:LPXTG cell wall anchor domain-containing protein n=1 Tax=Vagococcus silagei TaxID=2508885 RepID=A0A4S3BAG8_9ENTE|nr:LPXTG cell wall anchor domain-containing protein [Vagococcus silagei]THB62335.1 LPXTG cell wall anchor domain-containing protein [Vagococcus silagei]
MKQISTKVLVMFLTCFIVIASASLVVQATPGQNNVEIELKEKTTTTSTSTSTSSTSSSSGTSSGTDTTTTKTTFTSGKGTGSGGSGIIKYLPQTDEAPQNHFVVLGSALLVIMSGLIFWQRQRKTNE